MSRKLAANELGLTLEGPNVSLSDFAEAMTALDGLLKALSAEVAPDSKIVWEVAGLQVEP